MKVLAIDPGSTESAWCMIDIHSLRPQAFAKDDNFDVLGRLAQDDYDICIIEKVASYGMTVGEDVFDTCIWIGRFTQSALTSVEYIYRLEEKLHICGDSRARDANIRRALIDRFAIHDRKNGKGTFREQDFFYGFRADIWTAYEEAQKQIEKAASG